MAQPATADQLAVFVQQQQADEAAQLEDATAEEADAGASAAMTALVAGALTGWVSTFGALTAAGAGVKLAAFLTGLRRKVTRATDGLGPRAARAIEQALADAVRMGVRHALLFAGRAGARWIPSGLTADASWEVVDAARGVAATVREQLALMERLLSHREVQASGWQGVLLGLAAARRAVSLVRQAVAWCIHRAINEGAAAAIQALKARRLWVTEPDACVRCLAYAGHIADGDGLFPGGLSMDPASRTVGAAAIDGPPAHINCRCRLTPWRDEWAAGGPSLPDLLRGQALRAVSTGAARPSESRTARLRAARQLLTLPDVPPSVRRRARTAVAAGHF
jgi:hypothetical protein